MWRDSRYVDVEDFREMLKSVQSKTLEEFATTGQSATSKADGSLITKTDQRNHEFLVQNLPRLRNLPVFSEENYPIFEVRKNVEAYWLVDPLDGTREFASGLSDFCVLIALIEKGRPAFSTLLAPALDTIYWAEVDRGAFCEFKSTPAVPLLERSTRTPTRGLVSIFHEEPGIQSVYKANGIHSFVRKGSALKFIALLTGEADFYYRLHGPHEWDIAAGDLLVREAGGQVVDCTTGRDLIYNRENTRVPEFLAAAPGLSAKFKTANTNWS